MNYLIADSGSTKTDWLLAVDGEQDYRTFQTSGINPSLMSESQVAEIMSPLADFLAQNASLNSSDVSIAFYGAGCTEAVSGIVEQALRMSVPSASHISVHSDLLGAARALCKRSEGIACILGTGSNSCLYNGENIVRHTPPLGYVLGDEGSGAVFGRKLVNAVFKGRLPETVVNDFLTLVPGGIAEVQRRVYREAAPNRWLASLAHFAERHLDCPEITEMVVENFVSFIRINVVPYGRRDLPLNFVGGMAAIFQAQLAQAVEECGFKMGQVLRRPIQALADYHHQFGV